MLGRAASHREEGERKARDNDDGEGGGSPRRSRSDPLPREDYAATQELKEEHERARGGLQHAQSAAARGPRRPGLVRQHTRSLRDWAWLPRRAVTVLPSEVRAVHRREQRCACSVWGLLIASFAIYLAFLIKENIQDRKRPPQSVKVISDIEELNEVLAKFPNMVACYPSFAGAAEWLEVRHRLFYFNLSDAAAPPLTIEAVDEGSCTVVKDKQKGRCLFIDTSNLIRAPGSTVIERGLELYLAFVRALDQPASSIVYRGAYVTFTDKHRAAWCELQGTAADTADWGEVPLDDFTEKAGFLPYWAIYLNTAWVVKLKQHVYRPINEPLDSFFYYGFTPRLASYHMATDKDLLAPSAIEKIVALNDTHTHGVGRFIIAQTASVINYRQLEPVSIPNIIGNLAGAWSGIMAIFTMLFVSTESGRRRLPKPIRL